MSAHLLRCKQNYLQIFLVKHLLFCKSFSHYAFPQAISKKILLQSMTVFHLLLSIKRFLESYFKNIWLYSISFLPSSVSSFAKSLPIISSYWLSSKITITTHDCTPFPFLPPAFPLLQKLFPLSLPTGYPQKSLLQHMTVLHFLSSLQHFLFCKSSSRYLFPLAILKVRDFSSSHFSAEATI